MAVKKGRTTHEVTDDEAKVPLQAVLLADSFSHDFRPITLERPKVLLPLVNIPMIDYTLEWLASAGIEEVFVVCCAHAKQVKSYLDTSAWKMQASFKVVPIVSHDCFSVGGALRLIHQQNVVWGDFVLVSGDTVSNMSLKEVLKEHKERRRKDKSSVMTMVVKRTNTSVVAHQTGLGNDGLLLVIEPWTKELLHYDDGNSSNLSTRQAVIDNSVYLNKSSVCICSNLQDCYIDVCSQEVLQFFTENFDYQHLRQDFVKGTLINELSGNKIFTYEIYREYASCVDNLRSYSSVSNDIIQRWTYPLVPDIHFPSNSAGAGGLQSERFNVYRENGLSFPHSAHIGPSSVLGEGSSVDDNCVILNSVIGRNCVIGKNVMIEGSFVWNNVTIHDDAHIQFAVICDGCIIKAGATIEPGSILSFNVIIGPKFSVPSYSKISLIAQPVGEDRTDEEFEYVEGLSVTSARVNEVDQGSLDSFGLRLEVVDSEPSHIWNESEVGPSGAGYRWSTKDASHSEEWRYSLAPISSETIKEIRFEDQQSDLDDADQDCGVAYGVENEDDEAEALIKKKHEFENEAEETFRRIFVEGLPESSVCVELQALRVYANFGRPDCVRVSDCAGACFKSIIKLALEEPYKTNSELFAITSRLLCQWRDLLQQYLKNEDDQVELLLKFEEICLESGKAFAPIFCLVLRVLYEQETVTEDAILTWASEKQYADEEDKFFLKQCKAFIKWLQEAPEEDDL